MGKTKNLIFYSLIISHVLVSPVFLIFLYIFPSFPNWERWFNTNFCSFLSDFKMAICPFCHPTGYAWCLLTIIIQIIFWFSKKVKDTVNYLQPCVISKCTASLLGQSSPFSPVTVSFNSPSDSQQKIWLTTNSPVFVSRGTARTKVP